MTKDINELEQEFRDNILDSFREHGRARTVMQGVNLAWNNAGAPLVRSMRTINTDEFHELVDAALDADTLIADSAYPADEAKLIVSAILAQLDIEVKN